MNKSESKYFNTAVRMDEALMALLAKKDFEYITIKEICLAAGVNRSTFYLHYENTRDLLEETVARVHERFLSYFDGKAEHVIRQMQNGAKQDLLLITPKYLTPYLTFVRDYRRLYCAVMKNPSDFRVMDTYCALFQQIFNPILEQFSVPPEERSYRMAFYLNGIAAIVAEWLNDDCRKPIDWVVSVMMACIPQCQKDAERRESM